MSYTIFGLCVTHLSFDDCEMCTSSYIILSYLRHNHRHRHRQIKSMNHYLLLDHDTFPDSKVHVAHMGPTCGLSAPGRPHVGPMKLAIRVVRVVRAACVTKQVRKSTVEVVWWLSGLILRPDFLGKQERQGLFVTLIASWILIQIMTHIRTEMNS